MLDSVWMLKLSPATWWRACCLAVTEIMVTLGNEPLLMLLKCLLWKKARWNGSEVLLAFTGFFPSRILIPRTAVLSAAYISWVKMHTCHRQHSADCFLPLITALLIIAPLAHLFCSLEGVMEVVSRQPDWVVSQPEQRYAVINGRCLYLL